MRDTELNFLPHSSSTICGLHFSQFSKSNTFTQNTRGGYLKNWNDTDYGWGLGGLLVNVPCLWATRLQKAYPTSVSHQLIRSWFIALNFDLETKIVFVHMDLIFARELKIQHDVACGIFLLLKDA